jgi:hypothetical protein
VEWNGGSTYEGKFSNLKYVGIIPVLFQVIPAPVQMVVQYVVSFWVYFVLAVKYGAAIVYGKV